MLFEGKDFDSYQPIFDAKRLQKPGVLKPSRNFVFDVDGPRSAWASRFANFWQFDHTTRHLIKEFKVNDKLFYGTPTGIYWINPVSFAAEVLLPITTLRRYWPWSFARVGNRFYFAQHEAGLWQWNGDDGIWSEVPTPEPVKSICLSYGRLMCLGRDTVFFSALDDGTDFDITVVGGAGQQVLSILSKDAFRVDPVTDGVVIATSKGIIKGENVAAAYVFRWYVLSEAIFVTSPNMGIKIPDIGVVYATVAGFHLTDGGKPEPWEPGMGEFIKRNLIDKMDPDRIGCCRLDYLPSSKEFISSHAANNREGTFTQSWVYKIASGKWGRMDWPHHGFFEVLKPPYGILTSAYMDQWGFMQHLAAKMDKEILPVDGGSLLDYIHRHRTEPSPRILVDENGVTTITGITDLWWSAGENPNVWETTTQSGLYTLVETCYSDTVPVAVMDPPWTEE